MMVRFGSVLGRVVGVGGCLCGLLLAASVWGEVVRYQGSPRGSSVKIEGTSTVHDWMVEGKLIGGYMEVEGVFPSDLSVVEVPVLGVLPLVRVQIPVRSIKSGKSKMDSVMHKAMKQGEHGMVRYVLTNMTPSGLPRESGDPLRYDAEGDLSVAGVTRRVSMPVLMEAYGEGGLKIKGEVKVKMSDFGIEVKPPLLSFGLIKTGDEVDVTFEWVVVRKAAK